MTVRQAARVRPDLPDRGSLIRAAYYFDFFGRDAQFQLCESQYAKPSLVLAVPEQLA